MSHLPTFAHDQQLKTGKRTLLLADLEKPAPPPQPDSVPPTTTTVTANNGEEVS